MIDAQSTSEEAAEDIGAFVTIFFEHFSKFKGRPFHMAGESYAVRFPIHVVEVPGGLNHIIDRVALFQLLPLTSMT